MASIQKRGNRWFARYRDTTGRGYGQRFDRKVDAQRWLDEQTAALVTGQYVDPRAGRVLFRQYAETWRAAQVHRASSAAHVETMLRRHAYPAFGDRPIGTIRPSEIQAWVKGSPLAPSTVHVLHGVVSAIFRAAVRDRIIPASPCEQTKLPARSDAKWCPSRSRRSPRSPAQCPRAIGHWWCWLPAPACGKAKRSGSLKIE